MVVSLTACSNEKDALQARIDTLEGENAELQSTVSSLQADLSRAQADLSGTQSELRNVLHMLELALEENQASQQDSGPLAITYGGAPNGDMSWPFSYGDLVLGLRVNLNDFDEDAEIIWQSANEDIFTVVPGEDGITATVTPVSVGSAQLIVTIEDQETKSWVRIT